MGNKAFIFLTLSFFIAAGIFVRFFNKPLDGNYTDGYHVELDIDEPRLIFLLNGVSKRVEDEFKLAEYCYQQDDTNGDKKHVFFEYNVMNKKYLHVCFVTTTWDSKTLLVYYNIVNEECNSELINNEIKNKDEFINKFILNVLEPASLNIVK